MDTLDYSGFSYKMVNKLFPPKSLTILAGKYSIGKTTFATNLGRWLSICGESVLYLSLGDDAKNIYNIIGKKKTKRFFVCDIPGMSLEEIQLITKRHNFNVIILDYLQLIEGSDVLRTVGREFEMKHLIDSLSELARTYHTRIFAISQLSGLGDWDLSPSFEQSFPCKVDRFIFSNKLVVIHGKYQVHMPGDIPQKLDKIELIKYFLSSDDADPVPTSYSFTYE